MIGRIPFIAIGLCILAAGCERSVQLPSGVKYVELAAGTGPAAHAGDFVVVHFIGRLQRDDTEFDNSYERNPYLFRLGVGQEIKGWEEGIPGMKPGSKRKLYVPSALGYGKSDGGLLRPPDSDLVYEIELLRIVDGFSVEELAPGTGEPSKWMDTIEIRYTATNKNTGEKVESTDNVPPRAFTLGGGEMHSPFYMGDGAVVGMKVGGKRKITLPAEIAHGKKGRDNVPADADLVFEVELVSIMKTPPVPPVPAD